MADNIPASTGMATMRLEYIDIAKGIGIFLVVIGHCLGMEFIPNQWIMTFHMPLFFFLSGLCFNDAKYHVFMTFLKRRIETLFLPLLYFCVIGTMIGSIMRGPVEYLMEIWSSGDFPSGPTWFIYVLFLTELLYWLINRIARPLPYRVIVLLACLAIGVLLDRKGVRLPFKHCTVFAATFFYGIGHLCRGNIAARIVRLPVIIGGGMIIPLVSVLCGHVPIKMFLNSIPSPAVWTCTVALIGTAGILIVSNALTNANQKIKDAILYIGENTLVILWLHWYFLEISSLVIMPHMFSPFVYLALRQVIIWAGLIVCIELINRFVPWLVGKSK